MKSCFVAAKEHDGHAKPVLPKMKSKPNSVNVNVLFRGLSMNRSLKRRMRTFKNSVRKYDDGQVLVRELTSNTNTLPSHQLLSDFVHYVAKYEDTIDASAFRILWKRLTDHQTLRHVEKALLLIEHMLDQHAPYYSLSFERYCKDRQHDLLKLQHFHFIVEGSDIGQNVRHRATSILSQLFPGDHLVPTMQQPAQLTRTASHSSPNRRNKKPVISQSEYVEIDEAPECDIFDIFGELPAQQDIPMIR